MGIKKMMNAVFKSKAQNDLEKLKDEVNGLIKKLERLSRNRILQPDRRAEIAKIRAQSEQASRGAEMAYQKTRLEIMQKYISEEISAYETKTPQPPAVAEPGAAGRAAGVAAGEA